MSIDREALVDPIDYDEALYALVHTVLDRVIELSSQSDQIEDKEDTQDDDEDSEVVSMLRSQAAFTPAESNEYRVAGVLLNTLMATCISRRSALYINTQESE